MLELGSWCVLRPPFNVSLRLSAINCLRVIALAGRAGKGSRITAGVRRARLRAPMTAGDLGHEADFYASTEGGGSERGMYSYA